jgi:hypothetical protein
MTQTSHAHRMAPLESDRGGPRPRDRLLRRRLLGYEGLFVTRGIAEEAEPILGLRGVSADVAQLRLRLSVCG